MASRASDPRSPALSLAFLADFFASPLAPMSARLDWSDVAARLACACVVGLLLGFNRVESGKAAGARTTTIVCLAACLAMIEANALLSTTGRAADGFATMDPMRLPLGVLTGVGFIGAGAILRRGEFIVGLTTAAILWLATVLGLCAGGGRLALALVGSAVGLAALRALGWIEARAPRRHEARLVVAIAAPGPSEAQVRAILAQAGLAVAASSTTIEPGRRRYDFDLIQRSRPGRTQTPEAIEALAHEDGVERLEWRRGGLAVDAY